MKLLFENEIDFEVNLELRELFEKAAEEALRYEGFSDNVEIGLTLVSNEAIRELNKKFRGIDSETDVLSFPLIDFRGDLPDFTGHRVPLGDIVISIDRAKQQSKEYNHSLERELGFLAVHSMLHLMGYDHMTEEEEAVMFFKQKEILEKMGLKR
ncbi:MAG: rRNA maturation RNase YbeY [Clostridiales bacterium]|nr:rRNA maturation RNase YbeY [Clostridiales bacterium]